MGKWQFDHSSLAYSQAREFQADPGRARRTKERRECCLCKKVKCYVLWKEATQKITGCVWKTFYFLLLYLDSDCAKSCLMFLCRGKESQSRVSRTAKMGPDPSVISPVLRSQAGTTPSVSVYLQF